MKLKYKIMLGIITVGIGICLMTYQSYALWVASSTGGENIVNVGCFEIEYTENTNPISLYNSYPVSDQKGMSGTPYTFTIKNTCSIDSAYQITMNTFTTNQIAKEKMKYAFYKSGENKPTSGTLVSAGTINTDIANLGLANLETSYIIGSGQLRENESATYHYYMWIDSNAGNEVMGQRFEASIKVVSAATKIIPPATEYVTNLATTDTTNLAYDGTSDNNLRYIGSNPNNYVQFNNELWRIIGVMNNVRDINGNTSPKLKIIRNDSIGNYSWDSSDTSINTGWGVNEWSQADLNVLLNDYYYNAKSGQNCYNSSNNGTVACDFSSNGIKENSSIQMIANVIWNTGSNDGTNYQQTNISTKNFYELERSINNGKICSTGDRCNDTVSRTSEWTGKIGLMYPSDYGYATAGGSITNRETCLNKELYKWNDLTECYNNNWLYKNEAQWTISALASQETSAFAFYVTNIAFPWNVSESRATRPTLYLSSNVKIESGEGTEALPYILKLN